MEQKCKTGGESLRNGDAMSEDRISELPEALLLQILSTVPTKDVIAMSVLSKRWRSVWKMVPKLEFDSEIDHFSSEDVYRLLILHKAPFLESLHLNIEDPSGRLDIGILIAIAFSRHVRKLVLDLYDEDEMKIRFPSVLCSYNNTLEVLKLDYNVILDFPTRVCFNALRELRLHYVEFKDEASVCNLLSGCPRLQDLSVTRHTNFDAKTYTIAVPSLQRLTIKEDFSRDVVGGGYVINAPSLKYLNIQRLYGIDFCLLENAPEELVEAIIGYIPHIANENLIPSLTSAKRLSLYLPLEVKYPTGTIFYQLVSLELRVNEISGWDLLSFMLESSPKLQILKLDMIPFWKDCPVGWEWNQPKCVPECLLLHLETLVWTIYGWQGEYEKLFRPSILQLVATYILKNARQLKKATFDLTYIEPKELEKLEKRREMLNELANVVRASESCHLVVEPDDLYDVLANRSFSTS